MAEPEIDPEQAFRDALTRLGFTMDQQIAFIQQTGCRNVAMLGLLTSEQVSKVCKEIRTRVINPILISTIQEQLLLALRYWVINKQRLHQPVDARTITAVDIFNQAQVLSRILEDESVSDKEMVAKLPDKFKLASNWKIFAEALDTYLGQLKGTGRIPLKYVIRRYATPVPNTVFQNEVEESIALAPLTGETYQRDNCKVYGIIKQLVIEGPGHSYILTYDSASDGHAAWMAL